MSWIGDIARGLVEQYGTNNVFELCDYLGISIIYKDLNKSGSFFYRSSYGDEFIYLDSRLDQKTKKELIAHELGHALLHIDLGVVYYKNSLVCKSKLEKQADIFAAELLITPGDIDIWLFEEQTYKDLADCLEVSETIVKNKFQKYWEELLC